mmetsp:Transcript_1716/g.3537  ORF Transcript_1716/g.3537 Transcript_1716/m.3537 type:complete len:259 (-) Transcript_1716:1146-1922(-)
MLLRPAALTESSQRPQKKGFENEREMELTGQGNPTHYCLLICVRHAEKSLGSPAVTDGPPHPSAAAVAADASRSLQRQSRLRAAKKQAPPELRPPPCPRHPYSKAPPSSPTESPQRSRGHGLCREGRWPRSEESAHSLPHLKEELQTTKVCERTTRETRWRRGEALRLYGLGLELHAAGRENGYGGNLTYPSVASLLRRRRRKPTEREGLQRKRASLTGTQGMPLVRVPPEQRTRTLQQPHGDPCHCLPPHPLLGQHR